MVYGAREGLAICGRYLISTEEEIIEVREIMREINRRYADKPEYARVKHGEIFPTDRVPVLVLEDQAVQARLFTWGFPRWQGKGVIINARSETVVEKSMFRQDFLKRRCIIPSIGFYEWKAASGSRKKDKYLLRMADSPMLYMAGIYTVYEQAGMQLPGFVILTTAANPSMQPIHDRMPVIMAKHEQEAWLHDEVLARQIIKREGPQLEARLV